MTTPPRPVDERPVEERPADARSVEELAARRKRASRTALIAGGIAVLIYLAFIASGVLGQ